MIMYKTSPLDVCLEGDAKQFAQECLDELGVIAEIVKEAGPTGWPLFTFEGEEDTLTHALVMMGYDAEEIARVA